jgi:enamine deaminase RidA (YjgF/YER057c/UK114 family)
MDEKESILSEAKPETRLQKSMRGALRWVLVVLVAFGLGALLIAFALYIPTRQKLDKVNATITGKTDQITTLQTVNETLQLVTKNLDSATLHMYVLKALSSVRGASLAVAAGDYAGARLSLIQASEALDMLSGQLGTDQKDVLTAMQQSAAQALTEVKTNLKSAQPDLDQLTKNLAQLEGNLFTNP